MPERVFISGCGAVSPVGLTSKETWNGLRDGESGVDTIASFDSEGYDTTFAAEITEFDPEIYVGKKQARRMDRFVQFASAASLEALENSGLKITPASGCGFRLWPQPHSSCHPQF